MLVDFEKIKTKEELAIIKKLYLSSFSDDERREYNDFEKQLLIQECEINLITVDNIVVGFCNIWNFDEFAYIEHFAIEQAFRGKKIGQTVLNKIFKKYSKFIILEVEPPTTKDTIRRIDFYKKNGFYLLTNKYLQPTYGAGKKEVELKIMTTNELIVTKNFDLYMEIIKNKVYCNFDI